MIVTERFSFEFRCLYFEICPELSEMQKRGIWMGELQVIRCSKSDQDRL